MKLEKGSIAPIFTLSCNDGSEVCLSDLKGKNVVIYFYPKDNTPGCTIEAQDFSKSIEEFKKLDTIVLGISRDSIKSHCNFIEKYSLAFNLLSDPDSEACNLYGVLKEKSMFGKKYLGIDRSTFLVDKTGKISKIWRAVNVKDHVQEVLKSI